MPSLAFSGAAKHGSHIGKTLDVSLLRKVIVTAVRHALTSKSVLKILVSLALGKARIGSKAPWGADERRTLNGTGTADGSSSRGSNACTRCAAEHGNRRTDGRTGGLFNFSAVLSGKTPLPPPPPFSLLLQEKRAPAMNKQNERNSTICTHLR